MSGPATKVSIKALNLKCQPSSPHTLLTVLSSLASVSHKQNNYANQKHIRQMIRWHRGSPMCDLLNIRGAFERPTGRACRFPESIIFHKSHQANSASAALFFFSILWPPHHRFNAATCQKRGRMKKWRWLAGDSSECKLILTLSIARPMRTI